MLILLSDERKFNSVSKLRLYTHIYIFFYLMYQQTFNLKDQILFLKVIITTTAVIKAAGVSFHSIFNLISLA